MTAASLNAAHARALAGALVEGGVRHVIVSPGSRSTPLVLAFAAREDVTLHPVLDERAAAFVALGVGRATGLPAVLVCTSGTAPAHYLPAVIEASNGRVPLVVLTADRPPELHGCGALQAVDQAHLYGRHSRAFVDLGAPSPEAGTGWLGQVAARCLDTAMRAPSGPVHVNAPFREPLWEPESDAGDAPPPAPRVLRAAPMLGPELVAELAARVGCARRGVIVCGPLAPVTPAGVPPLAAAVRGLAAALGWPVMADAASQVRFARGAGAVLSAHEALLRAPAFALAHAPDLVLRFGQTPTAKATQEWLGRVGRGRTVLVDEAGDWHDPAHCADTLVVAEPAALGRALAAEVRPAAPGDVWLADWQRADVAAARALDAACAEGFWQGGVVRRLVAELPEGTALHVASSMPIRALDAFVPAVSRDLRVHANRGASGIDGIVATAAGEAVADPERPHVVLLGDLAFLHDIGGLRTAVELGASLVVVMIDNGGGGIFSLLPVAAHPRAFTPYFRMPQRGDVGALARAAGASWRRVTSYADLGGAVADALAEAARGHGVHVIAAPVDHDYDLIQHRRAFQAARDALAA